MICALYEIAFALRAGAISGRVLYPKAPAPSALRFLHFSALVNKFTPLQNAKTPTIVGAFVRGMRFELTRPFERYHLKVVRLPISPPTHRQQCQNFEGIAKIGFSGRF